MQFVPCVCAEPALEVIQLSLGSSEVGNIFPAYCSHLIATHASCLAIAIFAVLSGFLSNAVAQERDLDRGLGERCGRVQ